MGNWFREIFDPDSDYNKKQKEFIEKMNAQMRDDKCCYFCVHSEQQPHIEMGRESGTDDYCTIHKQLILEYGAGQQCIFWEEKDAENKTT